MMIWLIALMLAAQAPAQAEEPVPGPDAQLGFVEGHDHATPPPVLTPSMLAQFHPAGEADDALLAALSGVLREEPRAHGAALLRDEPGGYLLIVDAPGAGQTWRSGALTWPLLETARAALGEAAMFGVVYRSHGPDLPDYPAFYERDEAE